MAVTCYVSVESADLWLSVLLETKGHDLEASKAKLALCVLIVVD